MTFNIALDQFRVFNHVGYVPIKPVTLLTGGNSAGKSSFLAALRYLADIEEFRSTSSFNKDPFYLGAYEQLAHYRGGKVGRSKTFSFRFKARTSRSRVRRQSRPQDVEVEICFGQRLSQPYVKSIKYCGETSKCEISVSDDWKTAAVIIEISDKIIRGEAALDRISRLDSFLQDPTQVALLLEFAIDSSHAEEHGRARLIETIEVRSDLQSALSAVPTASYVGAPVRSRPARTYDPLDSAQQSEGAHVPSRLAQLARTDPQQWKAVRDMLVAFGKASSLFSDLEVRSLGRSDSDPFQVNVVINGPKRNIVDVGYGVSQSIPIIFELYNRASGDLFIVQQPEVHLHPEAQAALGTLFVNDIARRPGYIIAETHSDFLIDRVRRHIREGKISPNDVSLLYFERNVLSSEIVHIEIGEDGEIVSPPENYRTFFFREEMENLGLDVSDN